MKIYCVSIRSRLPRRQSIMSQDWGHPVEFFDAFTPQVRRPSMVEYASCCTKSHFAIISKHYAEYGSEPLLIIEDDAVIVEREKYDELLASPPEGWTNLGHEPCCKPPFFLRTHAMLSGGLTELPELTHDQSSTELGYHAEFPVVRLLDDVIVDFKAFVSDRDRCRQVPILKRRARQNKEDCEKSG